MLMLKILERMRNAELLLFALKNLERQLQYKGFFSLYIILYCIILYYIILYCFDAHSEPADLGFFGKQTVHPGVPVCQEKEKCFPLPLSYIRNAKASDP